jgi:hypothetical protein
LVKTGETMKNNSEIYKSNKLNLLFAALVLVTINLGCNFSCGNFVPTKPEMPSAEQQNALVKQTLKEFAKGVDSGDFSSLRSTGSKEFQAQVSADKLKDAFQGMIDKKDLLVPIMQSADSKTPQFTSTPSIKEEGSNHTLQLAGNFPTDKLKTNFDFKYVWQDAQWKLLTIKVELLY